ncbi:MAG: DUF1992 domain-containing protein [Desulfovibrio sp.]|jgi:hypothetical protein|nr:DUF1992 domain-containing protein [Desulfovibrio sp.]MBQ1420072.1 DUF1992 domain-containing protein [Desulfovibrio sp.]MBQ1845127.1 DUF1992 domain-containing protein [Desulfovibrio sp.]MBR4747706.1 DUF1992 domain-containing protein [Desulfovibrio sp.]MBR6467295.1 DUF1992 domain-containing protein [Desulfovibrio sp.]
MGELNLNPFAVIASIAEEKIREAQAEGAFDDLPGKGRPLQYEDDSGIPEDLRMAYKVLKNSGCLPPEIQERKEISSLAEMVEHCSDEQTRLRQMHKLEVLIFRAKTRQGRSLRLAEINDAYFDKLLDRIHVAKKK